MKIFLTIALLTFTLFAQDRVLLRIGQDGQQEAIPLRHGERTQDAIERMEALRIHKIGASAGLIDTLKYFTTENDLSTNFGFTHQDVAMQWYRAEGQGFIKEFWWRNYLLRGVINKGTIRSWIIDPRVADFPANPSTKVIGYYKESYDGDGGVQPFKPDSGNQWFYSNGSTDSVIYSFDMFTSETVWMKGGLQVMLDSNRWQHIVLEEVGNAVPIQKGELFGFTLSNDTKKTDFGQGTDSRMEILSTSHQLMTGPYHSFKFYETGRSGNITGWNMRGDYEWGMFVVIEYTTDRPPVIVPAYILTAVFAQQAKFIFSISDDNPGGGASGVQSAYFHFKKGLASAVYDSIALIPEAGKYVIHHPIITVNDTVFWYVTAADVNGNRSKTSIRKFTKYVGKRKRLVIGNQVFMLYPPVILAQDPVPYDFWSTKTEGSEFLPEIVSMYDYIQVYDGAVPYRNIYPALAQWLASGTPEKKKHLFLASQNYGGYITPNSGDTVFSNTAWEYQYLGINKIGPQDLPPFHREMRTILQPDTMTSFLLNYEASKSVTLWFNPNDEFMTGNPDAVTPRPGAVPLLKSSNGDHCLGVVYRQPGFNTVFLALDELGLEFRSDTSISAGSDWGYKRLSDLKLLSSSFFESLVTQIGDQHGTEPLQWRLGQNYPNPFNPSTTIEYSIPARSEVSISIYNTLGQKVTTLVNETKGPGYYRAEWNATRMASGIYFYELKTNNFTSVKKMLLLK